MTAGMVILAAGEGQRLRPLTNDRPKALVEVAGKSLIDWQIAAGRRQGLGQVAVVTGYKADRFQQLSNGQYCCRWYHNARYAKTNMVETMWCARDELRDQVIVAYGDILYEDSVLQAVAVSPAPISVVVDMDWRSYWDLRFADPLSDAESLRLGDDGRILELGQKAAALEEIQGQYIGLMKFRGSGIAALKQVYQALASEDRVSRSGKPVQNMYMTDLLQAIIDDGYLVQAVPVHRKWLEIDSPDDYALAVDHVHAGPNGLRISI